MSVNKAIVVGFVGKDPDIRATGDGRKVATFSVATSERWRDKASGERKEVTDWHRVVIFNEALANVAAQYVRRGSRVYVEGKMKTRKWTDQDGVDRYTTEIVLTAFGAQLHLLDRAERHTPSEDDYGAAKTLPDDDAAAARPPPKDEMADEIPF